MLQQKQICKVCITLSQILNKGRFLNTAISTIICWKIHGIKSLSLTAATNHSTITSWRQSKHVIHFQSFDLCARLTHVNRISVQGTQFVSNSAFYVTVAISILLMFGTWHDRTKQFYILQDLQIAKINSFFCLHLNFDIIAFGSMIKLFY